MILGLLDASGDINDVQFQVPNAPASHTDGPSGARAWAEYAASPNMIVVHDPVDIGAISFMNAMGGDSPLETYLFREKPNVEAFGYQHRAFVDLVGRNVAQLHYVADLIAGAPELESARQSPNLVYTRDALITLPSAPGRYIAGRMLSPIRQPESPAMQKVAEALGLELLSDIPQNLVLEGGDFIPYQRGSRRSAIIGYGRRTTRESLDYLRDKLIPNYLDEIIGVRLAEWRINLDGGLVPLACDVVVAQPDSLLEAVHIEATGSTKIDLLDMLRDEGAHILDVTVEESVFKQACNCLCLGNRTIVVYDMCPRLLGEFTRYGLTALTIAGSELVKGRGGPRCMSRPIY